MRHDAEYVRARLMAVAIAMGSQRALAKEIGVSPTFLNDILLGKREPVGKPLAFLGMRRVVSYEPIKHERHQCKS